MSGTFLRGTILTAVHISLWLFHTPVWFGICGCIWLVWPLLARHISWRILLWWCPRHFLPCASSGNSAQNHNSCYCRRNIWRYCKGREVKLRWECNIPWAQGKGWFQCHTHHSFWDLRHQLLSPSRRLLPSSTLSWYTSLSSETYPTLNVSGLG